MCSKTLRLDRGEQIALTRDVGKACDAYQQYGDKQIILSYNCFGKPILWTLYLSRHQTYTQSYKINLTVNGDDLPFICYIEINVDNKAKNGLRYGGCYETDTCYWRCRIYWF